jgi:hypothetical protein
MSRAKSICCPFRCLYIFPSVCSVVFLLSYFRPLFKYFEGNAPAYRNSGNKGNYNVFLGKRLKNWRKKHKLLNNNLTCRSFSIFKYLLSGLVLHSPHRTEGVSVSVIGWLYLPKHTIKNFSDIILELCQSSIVWGKEQKLKTLLAVKLITDKIWGMFATFNFCVFYLPVSSLRS